MNRVDLIGRISHTPDIRATKTGKRVASFSIAVGRDGKDAGCDFIRCEAWDKTADIVDKYCPKGKQVGITGRIRTGSYTDKEGRKVYTTDIVVDRLELLGIREDAIPQPAPVPKEDDNPYLDDTTAFAQLGLDALDAEIPFI